MFASDPRGKSSHYSKQTSVRFNNRKHELIPTQFIIDEHYVGEPPRVQVGFININDNIDEKFLRKEISKVGQIRTLEIVRNPQTRQHLGLAKVQFEDPKIASKCVETYNDHTLMGKKLQVFSDVRFTIIEEERLKMLNPEPKTRIEPIQAVPQNSLPLVHLPLSQTAFAPMQIPSLPQPDLIRPTNRLHAPLSLDDRLAKLGLKQTGTFPPMPPQAYPIQDRKTSLQYHQNHMLPKPERKKEVPEPALNTLDESEWNPKSKKVDITLTNEQIINEVIPFCYDRLIKDIHKNLLTTLRRKLIQNHGYPYIDNAQAEFKLKRDKIELEQRRQEQENVNRQREHTAMMQARQKTLEKRFVGRQDLSNEVRKRVVAVRHRTGGTDLIQGKRDFLDLRRINRSAALDENEEQHDRHRSTGSSSDSLSSRHSRSPLRSRHGSHSRSSSSSSSTSSTSSSSFSSSGTASSSVSSASSRSSYPSRSSLSSKSASPRPPTPQLKVDLGLIKSGGVTEDIEKDAAQTLLEFSNNFVNKTEPETKKRKKKVTNQENLSIKRQKNDVKETKPVEYMQLSAAEIARIHSTLDLTLEDLKFLETYHNLYEDENKSDERARVPFGSDQATVHLAINQNDIKKELSKNSSAKSAHPKWWNGCSRCSRIDINDKVKNDQTEDQDAQKAPIKSHVIQAANSTRRDQRNDQRRIAALNPEIDPSFLKQFTSNTLQLRAKNLRFSRSKIHKWGLFACEKIANGDAVIEYVGEKIRPSVADHREKIVYTNLPTHDGSSYFFRVDSDVIDATLKGNQARFINHSCNPNCIAKVIKHENGTNSIVIYAKQTIEQDDEITYDYKFPREETGDKIECKCNAPNCQKYLN